VAASLNASGTWAVLTADGAVTVPGTPASGMRKFLWVTWKPFGVTAQVTAPQGWTEITEYTDGAVADGANVGSVKVACYYRDHVGGDGNPTVDFSAGVIAFAVVEVWQKDASETWDAPVFTTGNITQGTYTVTGAANPGIGPGDVVFAFAGIRDDSATWTHTTTAITATGITWAGNVVESPATHGSTTTGNDLSADLIHRIASSGTASAAPVTTGTLAATETGAVLFVVQGVTVSNDRSGGFTLSHPHSISGTGLKGALAGFTQSHPHSQAFTGKHGAIGSFAASHGHTVSDAGVKGGIGSWSVPLGQDSSFSGTADVPEPNGGFALDHGHAVSFTGAKGAASPFSVSHPVSISWSGAKGGSGGWSVSHGSSTSATGRHQGAGSFAVSHPSGVAFDGLSGRLGGFSVSQGQATSFSGVGPSPPDLDGDFALSHPHAIAFTGSSSRSGGFSVSHGSVVAFSGEKVGQGSFAVGHPHTVTFSGSSPFTPVGPFRVAAFEGRSSDAIVADHEETGVRITVEIAGGDVEATDA
jgi:hypothetical protein